MKSKAGLPKFNNIAAMSIFGTIGIFVRSIPLPSSTIAFTRGAIGALFLLLLALAVKQKPSVSDIRQNLVILLISGGAIGINWILLFEAYKYTTVATATLCYYLAPVFLTMVSPLVFKEKLTIKKLICIAIALCGMVFVSGIMKPGGFEAQGKGIIFGIGAAILYATVIILNKFLKEIRALDKTIVQLSAASLVVLPYMLLTGVINTTKISTLSLVLLLIVGVVHTGIAYSMYFDSLKVLPAQTVAILSYIDPVVAIILSSVILKEKMDVYSIIGAVLILASTLISEIPVKVMLGSRK